ncbi:hypothetical protein LOC68_25795 [Blastopirellula sp. JC732]|uniref:Uncharacterized protein n=1 Tax=Blastopirellula sediminis TaxID=2894196 RepID=A0A9X1MR38_9BACT|nr:hypothetical protein [Blastopirellula sediminis]MCC9604878.1 hypothetical protein [Blastopirellula sediminis]MCC9631823.1 hypothetical protein [Blastopirellula sediminis]
MARQNHNKLIRAKTKRVAIPRDFRTVGQLGKRGRGEMGRASEDGFSPPEDWHEPQGDTGTSYRVVAQDPGEGFIHVVTEQDIRDRLAQLPAWMIEPLEVVQLSCLTRKKLSYPCYGMQWGSALYLYPMVEELIEYFYAPPRPAQVVEAKMYGATWEGGDDGEWRLVWTKDAIRDFYLNNVLIHELGHLLDNRNTSYVDRERYAEWFAIEYGYRPTRRESLAAQAAKKVVRRHHSS